MRQRRPSTGSPTIREFLEQDSKVSAVVFADRLRPPGARLSQRMPSTAWSIGSGALNLKGLPPSAHLAVFSPKTLCERDLCKSHYGVGIRRPGRDALSRVRSRGYDYRAAEYGHRARKQ